MARSRTARMNLPYYETAMTHSPIKFELRSFQELDTRSLYAVLAVRAQVFVVEQRCQYLDPDGKDAVAQHLLGFQADTLVTYLRILPAGVSFPEVGIGRVLTLPEVRGQGVGRALMLDAMQRLFIRGPIPVSLSAQAQLEGWYASMGFVATSGLYDDAGIPHVSMRRPALPLD